MALVLDDFTNQHLCAWIARFFPSTRKDEMETAYLGIRAYLDDHAEVLERGESWPDILSLATREGYLARFAA